MIQIKNLNFRYNFQQPTVFTDFSLELDKGNIVGLLGKNGTGKSTLLYLLCGLLQSESGTVTIDGFTTKERRPEMLQDIFIVPEEFDLPDITLAKFVELNRPFYPNFNEQIMFDAMKEFELPQNIEFSSLSMGQKKKAYMSFALATQTRYLFMDEPTNGLDIPSKTQFRKVIASQMTDERTIIISTHQVHDVEMLIDRVVMIETDHLLINATTNEICEKLRFELRAIGSDLSDALYMEPSVAGTLVVAPGNGFNDTPVNLELLFNALSQNPQLLDAAATH